MSKSFDFDSSSGRFVAVVEGGSRRTSGEIGARAGVSAEPESRIGGAEGEGSAAARAVAAR